MRAVEGSLGHSPKGGRKRGPLWTLAGEITFLSILQECAPVVPLVQTTEVLACQYSFSAAW